MIHLRTFAAGALFTIVVFAASSFGAAAPKPTGTHGIGTAVIKVTPLPAGDGPSDHDRLLALIKRVDALQNQLSVVKRTANLAAGDAASAVSLTDCVTGGVVIGQDEGTGLVDYSDASNPDAYVLPTLSTDCLVGS